MVWAQGLRELATEGVMHGPEYYEKKAIRAWLQSIGAWHCLPATGGYGPSGNPDIIACKRIRLWVPEPCWIEYGAFAGIEVKREGKGPSKLQELRIKNIQEAGGIAVWGTAEKVIPELRSKLVVT